MGVFAHPECAGGVETASRPILRELSRRRSTILRDMTLADGAGVAGYAIDEAKARSRTASGAARLLRAGERQDVTTPCEGAVAVPTTAGTGER